MTDPLFHEIPDAQVILRSKGVYRQAKLFRRGEDVFASWGSGFIRLLSAGGTTVPTNLPLIDWTQWQHDTAVKMRLEGKGATEIGEVIGKSRLAVIGHLWRRGISGRLKPHDGGRVAWERAKGL